MAWHPLQHHRRHRILIAVTVGVVAFGAAALLAGRNDGVRERRRSAPPIETSIPAARLNRPESLAVGTDGRVLIWNQGTHQILRQSTRGDLEIVAGTGARGFAGDGDPAVDAELGYVGALAVARDGTIYFADADNNRVRAISPAGQITTIVGTGTARFSGAGGPATAAEVFQPNALAQLRQPTAPHR